MSTDANGRVGRTDTICCFDVEKVLCNLVLERVEGDDPKAPIASEERNSGLQSRVERLELAVHRDAKRLERSGGYVDVPRPGGPGNRSRDDIDEVFGGPKWLARPPGHDALGDAGPPPFLPVAQQDPSQLAGRFSVQQVGGGPRFGLVEPHVERPIALEAEPALRVIQLHRRHPEVEDDAVGSAWQLPGDATQVGE